MSSDLRVESVRGNIQFNGFCFWTRLETKKCELRKI